jgi:hypothetical protein
MKASKILLSTAALALSGALGVAIAQTTKPADPAATPSQSQTVPPSPTVDPAAKGPQTGAASEGTQPGRAADPAKARAPRTTEPAPASSPSTSEPPRSMGERPAKSDRN